MGVISLLDDCRGSSTQPSGLAGRSRSSDCSEAESGPYSGNSRSSSLSLEVVEKLVDGVEGVEDELDVCIRESCVDVDVEEDEKGEDCPDCAALPCWWSGSLCCSSGASDCGEPTMNLGVGCDLRMGLVTKYPWLSGCSTSAMATRSAGSGVSLDHHHDEWEM